MEAKRLVFIFIGLSMVYSAISEFIQPTTTSPALLWSNKNFFSGKNIQILDFITIQNIQDAFATTPLPLNPISKFFNKISPEVVFVFAEPYLTTEEFLKLAGSRDIQINGGSFSNLMRLISSSTSSLVAPYVNITSGIDISSFAQRLPFNKVVTVKSTVNADSGAISIQQLQDSIGSGDWDLSNNGVVDLVVIYLDGDYINNDKLIGMIDEKMELSSYVGIFTSNKTPVSNFKKSFPRLAKLQEVSSFSDQGDSLFPNGVVAGLIIMIPFLIILAIGVTCTFNVQSSLKFEVEKVKKQ